MKLISLNIERSKHLDLVVPFLSKREADVVCLQEVMEYDIPVLEAAAGTLCDYTPTTIHDAEGKPGRFGQAIFSRLSITKNGRAFYWGGEGALPVFDFTNAKTKHETECHAVSYADIEKEGEQFRIATTHFTWTSDGEPDDLQRQDLKVMLRALEGFGQFVFCGDFNAPRGGEIFSAIAEKFKDNIPPQYATSIDGSLHRAGDLQLMVDGLFTTPNFRASDVRLEFGVSDHAAIVAKISHTRQPR